MLLTYTKLSLARLMLSRRLISLAITAVVSLLLLTVPAYSSGQPLFVEWAARIRHSRDPNRDCASPLGPSLSLSMLRQQRSMSF